MVITRGGADRRLLRWLRRRLHTRLTYRSWIEVAAGTVAIVLVTLAAWTVAHPDSVDASVASGPSPTPVTDQVTTSGAAALTAPVRHQRQRPAYRPCARNDKPQLILVSIKRQHEWACEHHRTVLSTPVTTGKSKPGDSTPRGTFAVQGMDRNTRLTTSADGSYDVKYWIPFHVGIWGFHDSSWQRIPYGSPAYTRHGSHGCVHMPLPAIRKLYHWVHYGTPVRIT